MARQLLLTVALLACVSVTAGPGAADEIDYIEQFSLSSDRTAALEQLIPGTAEYYYYHALHYQNTEQFDKVEEILTAWIKRYQYTSQVNEILNRQALLTYSKNPEKSLARIRQQLNLQFNHQRETVGTTPDLPSKLDQKQIGREQLLQQAYRHYKDTTGLNDSALEWLIGTELDPIRRRHLLSRIRRPDYDGFVDLVLADLQYKDSRGFGSVCRVDGYR